MKQKITYACLIGSFIIICLASNIVETLVMFLLFGYLPGQTSPFSPQEMLAFYSTICALLFIRPLHKRINTLTNVGSAQTS